MFSSNLHNTLGFDEEHPGARLLADHALQKEVCRSHLALVEALPEALDGANATRLIEISRASWEAHVRFHEDVIAAVVPQQHDDTQRDACLGQLQDQHAEISLAIEELLETAADVKSGAKPVYALAYLLRRIAERRHEHVMVEKLLVLQTLPLVLSPVERASYHEWVAKNPWPLSGMDALI